jgi:hypothetical protein
MTNLKFLKNDSFLQFIKNSIGTRMFRNSYYSLNNKKTDILQNGSLSCAVFASSLLFIFKFIKDVHATVDGTIRDLEESGWEKVNKAAAGDVIIWEAIEVKGRSLHKHIGFYLGNNQAVSNSSKTGLIAKHHLTYGAKAGKPKRKIESIYRRK